MEPLFPLFIVMLLFPSAFQLQGKTLSILYIRKRRDFHPAVKDTPYGRTIIVERPATHHPVLRPNHSPHGGNYESYPTCLAFA